MSNDYAKFPRGSSKFSDHPYSIVSICIIPKECEGIFSLSLSLSIYIYIYIYLTCPWGGGIRTSDLCFIRCGPQPIDLPLGIFSTFEVQQTYNALVGKWKSTIDI